MGIRRDTSGEPSMAKRRESFSMDEVKDKKEVEERKQSLTEELQFRRNSVAITEVIPEVAIETEDDVKEETRGREPARAREDANPTKQNGTSKSASSVSKQRSSPPTIPEEKETEHTKPAIVPSSINSTPLKQKDIHTLSPKKSPTKSVLEPMKTKESAQSTTPKVTSSTPAKTPAKSPSKPTPAPISTTKINSTPARLSPQKQPLKSKSPAPKSSTIEKPTRDTSTASTSAKENAAQEVKATPEKKVPQPLKTKIGISPPQQHFVKPKPRSPTRPVKLPSSLTAHTASSGSKTANASTTTSHPVRSNSRASAVSSTTKTLQRKPSVINKTTSSRPSFGPPPTKETKKETGRTSLPGSTPGDDFLARMMRPTTSSASKTAQSKEHEKTPPKKVLPKVKQVVKKVAAKVEGKTEEKKEEKAESARVEKPAVKQEHVTIVSEKRIEPVIEKEETQPVALGEAVPVQAIDKLETLEKPELEPQVESKKEEEAVLRPEVTQNELSKTEVSEPVTEKPAESRDSTSRASSPVDATGIVADKGSEAKIQHVEQADIATPSGLATEEKDATVEGKTVPLTSL